MSFGVVVGSGGGTVVVRVAGVVGVDATVAVVGARGIDVDVVVVSVVDVGDGGCCVLLVSFCLSLAGCWLSL